MIHGPGHRNDLEVCLGGLSRKPELGGLTGRPARKSGVRVSESFCVRASELIPGPEPRFRSFAGPWPGVHGQQPCGRAAGASGAVRARPHRCGVGADSAAAFRRRRRPCVRWQRGSPLRVICAPERAVGQGQLPRRAAPAAIASAAGVQMTHCPISAPPPPPPPPPSPPPARRCRAPPPHRSGSPQAPRRDGSGGGGGRPTAAARPGSQP